MNRVKDIIASANLTCHNCTYSNNKNKNETSMDPGGARVFPLSKGYSQWETDEVIAHELYRNLALAIGKGPFRLPYKTV